MRSVRMCLTVRGRIAGWARLLINRRDTWHTAVRRTVRIHALGETARSSDGTPPVPTPIGRRVPRRSRTLPRPSTQPLTATAIPDGLPPPVAPAVCVRCACVRACLRARARVCPVFSPRHRNRTSRYRVPPRRDVTASRACYGKRRGEMFNSFNCSRDTVVCQLCRRLGGRRSHRNEKRRGATNADGFARKQKPACRSFLARGLR